MAVSQTDVNTLVTALMGASHQDPAWLGRVLGYLEQAMPAVAWQTTLANLAGSYAPFTAWGLSSAWFVNEVARCSAQAVT